MYFVQLANSGEQILLWFFRVTLKINVKIVSSKPIQDHVNVLNVSLGRSDAPRTGGFRQERPSLDLREDENGGCNDRD